MSLPFAHMLRHQNEGRGGGVEGDSRTPQTLLGIRIERRQFAKLSGSFALRERDVILCKQRKTLKR